MKLPNLPELQAKIPNITAALAAGKSHEEIFAELRAGGVITTMTRVLAFCDAIGSSPETATAAPSVAVISSARPQRFPELENYRERILHAAQGGCKPLETWAVLTHAFKVNTTEERVAAYAEQLLHEAFPPGPIQKRLFEVAPAAQAWPNNSKILSFGEAPQEDVWTVGDFSEGTGILGATGSGKSSGSGKTIAFELISHGYGGLVLTTKKGEADEWAELVAACQRGEDFSIVRHDGPLRLNLLQYEMERPGPGSEQIENIVDFFKNLLSVMGSQRAQVVNANFWQLTGEQLLRNLINCFLMARLPVTLDGLCEFVANAPTSEELAKDGQWQQLGVFGDCLTKAREAANSASDLRVCRMLEQYWLKAYPTLAPETRSCITISFSAMLDALRARHIYDMVSTVTTITPESIFNGRIVVLDLPVNEFQGAGLLVQAAWKYLFQRAILRRPDKDRGNRCRPVFLWEDEAQNFLIEFDADFQARARDCRVARVMLTQNLNCLYERFGGGDAARVKVEAILGNLNTKLFHANGDLATNRWASDCIGTTQKMVPGKSTTPPHYHGLNPVKDLLYAWFKKPVVTDTESTVREAIMQPNEFVNLLTGGPRNGCVVEAIATRVGRPFADGRNFMRVAFKQPALAGQ